MGVEKLQSPWEDNAGTRYGRSRFTVWEDWEFGSGHRKIGDAHERAQGMGPEQPPPSLLRSPGHWASSLLPLTQQSQISPSSPGCFKGPGVRGGQGS